MEKQFEATEELKPVYIKAVEYLAARDYSRRGLRNKLVSLKKRFPKNKRYDCLTPENVDIVLDYLVESGMLNERRAVRRLFEHSLDGVYGKYRIKQKLLQRKFSKEIVDEEFREFQEDAAEADFTRIIEKTRSRKRTLEHRYAHDAEKLSQIKTKLIAFLSQRGYDYDEIQKILTKLYD